ncbi:MAG: nucleotidyltransferase family protein [Lachnospiraceae bacterium]|nr:nucleotidyltransferase family protein [Lachnospiraceae bacterium]
MNQLLFDGRSLVGIVSSIIRQNELHVNFNRIDWERMYRIADYHKVANIVYLAILGYSESVPERWRERFFGRYQESLQFGENYKESIQEVLAWLDARNISCTVLTSEIVREFYRIPEAADTSPLRIYLDEGSYTLAKGYLIDLGYEVEATYEGTGERFSRISAIPVELYYAFPFRAARYIKEMRRLVESACEREGYKRIHALSVESEFVYRMASAAYRYVTDEVTMREIIELQVFHKTFRDRIRMDAVQKRLKDFEIDGLAEKLLRISYMWFGDRKDTYYDGLPEDMSVYDILEERLLTRGIINHETDSQALKLEKSVRKELEKEKKGERIRQLKAKMKERFESAMRVLRWIFPDYHYMASIYPILEKLPVLLPVFWVSRGIRLLIRIMKR